MLSDHLQKDMAPLCVEGSLWLEVHLTCFAWERHSRRTPSLLSLDMSTHHIRVHAYSRTSLCTRGVRHCVVKPKPRKCGCKRGALWKAKTTRPSSAGPSNALSCAHAPFPHLHMPPHAPGTAPGTAQVEGPHSHFAFARLSPFSQEPCAGAWESKMGFQCRLWGAWEAAKTVGEYHMDRFCDFVEGR